MNVRAVALLGWAGVLGAAQAASGDPAEVRLEAVPEASAVVAEELPPESRAGSEQERIDRFALEGPRFLPQVSRVPLAELRGLASLRGEEVKKAANPHDPLKLDEFRTLFFDGLEIHGYLGDQEELWPIRITVTSAAWDIAEGLKVGTDAARVTEILGEPTTRRPEAWLYQGGIQNVNFFLRRDKIEKIEFIYYLD